WMDMRMPQMDGYQATRHIRALEAKGARPRSVILALTASAFEHDRPHILEAGCDGIVLKPYSEEAIFSEMENRLGVCFVREAPRGAPPVPASLVLADRLAALPHGARSGLREALQRGDDLLALRCAEAIARSDAELSEELKRLL